MSCTDFLSCIGNFISEFARLILFFASILFVGFSIGLLVVAISGNYTYELLGLDQSSACFYAIIVLCVVLIVLGVLGFYGTFFRSQSSLESFAAGTSLIVLVSFGVLMYVSPRIDEGDEEVGKKLSGYLDKYDWNHNDKAPWDIKNITYKWDTVQELHRCCGVSGPKDWEDHRPATFTGYPSSCCKNATAAKLKNYDCSPDMERWMIGCKKGIHDMMATLPELLSALVWINLILACVACVVMLCSSDRTQTSSYNY